MPNDRIMKEWDDFLTKAVPLGWGPAQKRAMRYAFFAGAVSMAGVMKTLSKDVISEDDAIAVLEEIDEEFLDFGRKAATGEL